MFLTKINYKKAFTLAEMLITLVIISIISTLCVNALKNSYEKKEAAVQLQKVYEDISKAVANGVIENDSAEYWDFSISQVEFFNTYLPTLNVVKKESYTSAVDGNPPVYHAINGSVESLFNHPDAIQIFQLPNGAQLFISTDTDSEGITIPVDINGFKKQPNTLGKDFFTMYLANDGTLKFWISLDSKNNHTHNSNMSREELMNGPSSANFQCNKQGRGHWCGALIQKDGWKIKDDYPW